MLEILVVIILIGILATIITPRMFSAGNRRAAVEAETVRTLLSRLGQKDALNTQPIALVYDAKLAQLSLEVAETGDSAEQSAELVWVRPRMSPPVVLTSTRLVGAGFDGQLLAPTGWRIELVSGMPRPSISLCLATGGSSTRDSGNGGAGFGISLPGGALFATTAVLGETQNWSPSRPLPSQTGQDASGIVDLDAQGGRTAAW